MKLFSQLSSWRHAMLWGTAGLAFLGLMGCHEELFKPAKRTKEILKVLESQFTRTEVKSQTGNPGRTSVTMTGPGGAQTTMTAPGFATDCVIADLDNDGQVDDVAYVTSPTNLVTVILLVGDRLQPPVTYPAGTNPVAVAAGDLNGDRVTDLVTANGGTFLAGKFTPGSLSLLLGKGDGTFGAASTLTARSPGDVGLGDFNGDGKLDLAVANGSNLEGAEVTTKSLLLRMGTGNGAFGPEIPVPTAQRTLALEVLDFNPDADGHDDIVTTGSILLGRGDGSFAAPVNATPGLNPNHVHVQDLNQDQKPDLIFLTGFPDLAAVVLGRGDGTVSSPRLYVLDNPAEAVAYFDANEDGERDLLFTNAGTDSTFLPGRGNGTFQAVEAFPTISQATGQTGATGAAVADFTGEGVPDVVVANGHFPASLMPGLGGGGLGAPAPLAGLMGQHVVTGDWNGDGKADLAFVGVGQNSPLLRIALGQGAGAFGPAAIIPLPGSSVPPTLVVASLNDDAAPDLLLGNMAVDEVSVFLGNGAGGFTAQAPVKIGATSSNFATDLPPSLAVGDFNGDTHPDVAVAYRGEFGKLNGGLKIAFGKGDGAFQAPRALRNGVTGLGVAAADFNRDGNLDLALAMEVTTFDWDVAIYLGQGDGTFAAPKPLGLKEDLVSGVIVLDGDRDGKPDLGVPLGGDAVLGLRGLGGGAFTSTLRAPIGGGEVMTADLNQDGWPDLLAPNGHLGLYLNDLPKEYPLLQIARVAGKVRLLWPEFFPDLTLSETPALDRAFTPTKRPVAAKDGYFQVELETGKAPAEFFRLEPKR